MAKAFGMPIAERLADQREFFQSLFQIEGYQVKPLDLDGLLLDVQANGKILEITDRLGGPPISLLPNAEDMSFGLDTFAYRKQGQWRFIR